MLISLLAAAALFTAQDAPVATAPAVIPQAAIPTDIPVLEPAVLASDCGGLLRSAAFCITARMDQIGPLADTYLEQLAQKNWLAADGDDNRVILIKRREGGGCDGLQMVAFFDPASQQNAEDPAFLGFAYIPGDVCAAPAGGAAQ